MDFKALKTVFLIFIGYVVAIILLWSIFDLLYLTNYSSIKASVQIEFKEMIFYTTSILTFIFFLNKIYKSNYKKEYFLGVILLIICQVVHYLYFG